MASKTICIKFAAFLNVIALLVQGCGGGSGTGSSSGGSGGVVGATVNSTPDLWRFYNAGGERVFYGYDPYVNRIMRVSLNAATVEHSSRLSVPARTDSWFAGPEGKIFFTMDDKSLSILNPETGASTLVKTFAGRIVSVAAEASQGLYAFVDEYSAITLLSVSQTGTVEGQWTGGPILGDGVVINAGDILPGGKFVVGSTAGKFAVINIKDSIASSSWKFTTQTLTDGKAINFVAPVKDRSDRVVIGTQENTMLIDVNTGAIVDTEPTGANGTRQKNGRVHVAYLDTTTDRWKFIAVSGGDSFTRFDLPNNDILKLKTEAEQSYLTDSGFNLVLKGNGSRSRRVVTMRLSDALVEKSFDINASARIGLSDDGFSAMDPSALGSISVYNLTTGATKSFLGYNRQILQKE